MTRAWVDREHWPASVRRKLAESNLEPVIRFIAEAGWEIAARRFEQSGARLAVPHRASESRIAFFRDVEAALDEDPAGPRGQALARRWEQLAEADAGGDPDAKTELMRSLNTTRHWPARAREYVAGLYMTTPETLERIVAFLSCASDTRNTKRV